MADRIRGFDWASTSLGSLEDWPQSLRTCVDLLLHSPVPIVLLWGADGVMIYNDAYSEFAGGRHPRLLGSKVLEGWPEVADFNRRVMEVGLAGDTLSFRDQQLVLYRNGVPEDVWMNLDYSPVHDESGRPKGVLAIVVETSERVRAEQRVNFQLDLAERLLWLSDPGEVKAAAAEALGRTLRVGRVGYGEIDGAGLNVTVERDWTDGAFSSLAGESRPLDSFGPAIIEVLREGRTLRLDDIAADPRSAPYAEGYASIGARAMVVAPMIRDGQLIAILYLHEPQPRRWTDLEVSLVQDVAARTWSAVERARSEAALRESEARFRAMADSAPAPVFVTGREGGVAFANRAFEEFAGRPADQLLGNVWLDIMHPDDVPAVAQRRAKAWADQASYQFEARFRSAAGEWLSMQVSARPRFDSAGVLQGYVGMAVDLTETRRAEAELRESEERFRVMADSAPALIWATNSAGDVIFANRRYETELGLPRDQTFRDRWREIVHVDDAQAFHAGFREIFAVRSVFQAEVRVWDKAGRLRWLRCEGVPRFSGTGEFLGYVGCNVDVTEAKLAADELEALVQERTEELQAAEESLRQAQKMEAVGQLTGGIAHDFNNLLTAVVGGLDMIQRRAGDERTKRIAANALQAAERGAKLTSQLLAFSRTQRLAVEPVRVNPAIERMGELLAGALGSTIELEFRLNDAAGAALTDANQLELAVLNLAINARDALDGVGRVMVSTATEQVGADQAIAPGLTPGPYVVVSVADNGPGMSPDVLARAFDPFYTTKPVGQGTGLGLSQVYGIARQSGGAAVIDSTVGRGTTVRVYLPLAETDAETAHAGPADRVPAAGGARGAILVVDDDPDVRRFIVDSLEMLGFKVSEAEDGPRGLELFRREQPDLLLLDFAMPGMNGAEVAEAARRLRPDQRVLFASGYADTAAIESAAGDAAILRKPFRLSDLAAAVEGALAN